MTMREGENNMGKAEYVFCAIRRTVKMNVVYLNSLSRLPVDVQFNTRADTISAVYAPSFRSTRRELRVCVSTSWTSVFHDIHLPKVYLLRAMSSRDGAPETTGEILDENLLTVDELKPLEGFAFQFLVLYVPGFELAVVPLVVPFLRKIRHKRWKRKPFLPRYSYRIVLWCICRDRWRDALQVVMLRFNGWLCLRFSTEWNGFGDMNAILYQMSINLYIAHLFIYYKLFNILNKAKANVHYTKRNLIIFIFEERQSYYFWQV